MPTVIETDPKGLFLIATKPRCRGGYYSFPEITPLNLDPYLIMLSIKQGGINYYFLRFWYDLTWYFTPVSRAITEHSIHYANRPV